MHDGLKSFQEKWLQKREVSKTKRRIKEVEKHGRRRFRTKINDSDVFKNDGRVIKEGIE